MGVPACVVLGAVFAYYVLAHFTTRFACSVQGSEPTPQRKQSGGILVPMLLLGGFLAIASWLTALSAVRSAGSLETVAAGSSSDSSSSSGSASHIKEYGKTGSKQATKTFADVCGCNEAREELKDVVEFLKHPGEPETFCHLRDEAESGEVSPSAGGFWKGGRQQRGASTSTGDSDESTWVRRPNGCPRLRRGVPRGPLRSATMGTRPASVP